jgi:hypothetical protein
MLLVLTVVELVLLMVAVSSVGQERPATALPPVPVTTRPASHCCSIQICGGK